MNNFAAYLMAQERTKAAFAASGHADVALELARIQERLAEIRSQHEPLATIIESTPSARERAYAAAFWVVVGRMPEKEAP